MAIYIASDHGGFELKSKILAQFKDQNLVDLGPYELNPNDDYPIYVDQLVKKVLENGENMGILICRSGIGMCITANKYKNIYAALAFTTEHAQKAREHTNANVLCLDADYDQGEDNFEIIKTFITTKFAVDEPRHQRRINEVKNIEMNNFK